MIQNLKLYATILMLVAIVSGVGYFKYTLHRVEVLEIQKKELLQANAVTITTMKRMSTDYVKALELVKKAHQDQVQLFQVISDLKEATKNDEDGAVAPVLRNSLNRLRAFLISKTGDL